MREVMRNKRNGFTTRILREDKREKGKLTPDDNGNVIGNLARATTRDIPVSQKEAPSTTWRSRGDHVLDKSVTCPPDRVLYSGRPVGLFRVLLCGCILELLYLVIVALAPLPGLRLSSSPLVTAWPWTSIPSHLLFPGAWTSSIPSPYDWPHLALLSLTLVALTCVYAFAVWS